MISINGSLYQNVVKNNDFWKKLLVALKKIGFGDVLRTRQEESNIAINVMDFEDVLEQWIVMGWNEIIILYNDKEVKIEDENLFRMEVVFSHILNPYRTSC